MIIIKCNRHNIGDLSRRYPLNPTNENIEEWLKEQELHPSIEKFITLNLAKKMYTDFRTNLEDKIEQIIQEEFHEEKLPIRTKVKSLTYFNTSFRKGDIATIENVIRLEENPFCQGWYRYTLDNGFVVYSSEIKPI